MLQKILNRIYYIKPLVAGMGLILLLVPVTNRLLAQEPNHNDNLSVGIEGGIHFTNITNPGYPAAPTSLIKPIGGIFGIYTPRTFPVGFKSGLYFDVRGYQSAYRSGYLRLTDTGYIGHNSYFEYQLKSHLQYLTIPFIIVLERGTKKFKVTIEAGIYYSLLLTNNVTGFNNYYIHPDDLPRFADSTLTSGNHSEPFDQPIEDFFNTYDFGFNIAIGLGYEIKEGVSVLVNPGFSYGFANVLENPDFYSKWDNTFHFRVGILYKLHSGNLKKKEK